MRPIFSPFRPTGSLHWCSGSSSAGSDYAPTAKRLKERPRVKRAALAPAASPAPGATDTGTTSVDTPVVKALPVYEPSYYHRPYWRHRHLPHDGKPAGAGRHDKPGKFAKTARPARVARTAQPTKFAKFARPAKTPTVGKPTKFAKMSGPAPHTMTANRPTMMKTMNTAPRASFGHAGGGGGRGRRR